MSEIDEIETEIKKDRHQTVIERYYTKRYCLNVRQPKDDYCVLIHSNRVCVVTLAPSHYLFGCGSKIAKLDFKVSRRIDRLDNKVSGKWKHGAQKLQPTSPLFLVEMDDSTTYTVVPGITGKLLEVNETLLTHPELMLTKPQGEGFLAIILPDISTTESYRENGVTHEQYQSIVG